MTRTEDRVGSGVCSRTIVCCALLLALAGAAHAKRRPRFKTPTRSSTIRVTRNDKLVVVVNRETNSLAVLQVRAKRNRDVGIKVAEIPVGLDPRSVAVDPLGRLAFVTNGASGTVSVVTLVGDNRYSVIAEIRVGNEPRGCTLTANGTRLFVANYTDGTVSVIDTRSLAVVGSVPVGGHPSAIAITNDRDGEDSDETVFVTDFFSELIQGKQEPF